MSADSKLSALAFSAWLGLFGALCAAGETPVSQPEPEPPVAVVVRTGRLSAAEVSPSPMLNVPVLWKLALEGVSVTRLELERAELAPASADALARMLLPSGVPAQVVEAAGSSEAAPLTPALARLRELFPGASAASPDEISALEALRKALGASRSAVPAPASVGPARPAFDAAKLKASRLSLLRVRAVSDAAAEMMQRDEMLGQVRAALGPTAHVIVVNLPERGPGTLIAVGPRFKRGRILDRPKSVLVVAAVVAKLLNEPGDGASKEVMIDELFK